jgi:acyl-CoA thioester hydrolase
VAAHTSARRVQWGETDAAAIVFYPNYFRWFDEATHALFLDIGYPISAMMSDGYAVPIIEVRGQFRTALHYGDDLSIESRVAEVRTRSFRVDHTVSRAGQIVSEGYEVRIWVRLAGQGGELQPEVLPDDLRERLTGE